MSKYIITSRGVVLRRLTNEGMQPCTIQEADIFVTQELAVKRIQEQFPESGYKVYSITEDYRLLSLIYDNCKENKC